MTGKELQQWREDRDLSREELAKLLDVTYTTIYRWESDQRAIPNFLSLALVGLKIKPGKKTSST